MIPEIMARARPWKIGSESMNDAPTMVESWVRKIGTSRTAPALTTAFSSGSPDRSSRLMKSTSRIELRTMMPARAIKPIIEVAVKKTPKTPCAGRMPTRVSGIGTMMMIGVIKDLNHPTINT